MESFDSGDQAQISSAIWHKSQWAGNTGSSIPEWSVIGYLNLLAAILTRLLIQFSSQALKVKLGHLRG